MSQNAVFMKVKDHSVSGNEFSLRHNKQMDMLITDPQPTKEELGNYYKSENYISHTDSKRNLFEWIYHLVRSITLRRKVGLIKKYSIKESKQLLDVGCGTGDFLKKANGSGWDISGIEPDDGARLIASEKTGIEIFKNTSIALGHCKKYDVITLWHVLEHLPDLYHQIECFQKLLKTNGVLLIAVPNFKSYDAQVYNSFWAAYDVPRHLWHFSKTSIDQIAEKYNMAVMETLPMRFDAYYVSMLSEKNQTGAINVLRSIRNGFTSNFKARTTGEYSSLIYIIKNK